MSKVKKKVKLKLRERKKKKGETRRREEEKEEIETETGKRRCEGFVSVEPFEFFSQGRDSESCGDVSWEHPWSLRTCLTVGLFRVSWCGCCLM